MKSIFGKVSLKCLEDTILSQYLQYNFSLFRLSLSCIFKILLKNILHNTGKQYEKSTL